MSTKIFDSLAVQFPTTDEAVDAAFNNCKERKRFVEVSSDSFKDHLDMAKDDLVALNNDYEKKSWRWVITKAYYAVFHATNAFLIKKQGYYSKDHVCAVLALKKEQLLAEDIYRGFGKTPQILYRTALKHRESIDSRVRSKISRFLTTFKSLQIGGLFKALYTELRAVYERFSDIFGFAILFEARKLSQYDVVKWKELTEEDATLARDFSTKYVAYVERQCA